MLITLEGLQEYSKKSKSQIDWNRFLKELESKLEVKSIKEEVQQTFEEQITEREKATESENNQLQIIDERKVLGKQFKIYDTLENPLFLARDVAEWIEHSNPSKMIKDAKLEESEIVKQQISTLTNSYSALFLTEDGLYEVLMQSKKPIAKEFKKEVKKILKQIRLTGGYVATGREEEFIDNYFGNFSDEVRKVMLSDLQLKNRQLRYEIENNDKLIDMIETTFN
jgi:prophage antirepressor-like protein